MKKVELQAQAEKCLVYYEELLSKEIERRNYEEAAFVSHSLSGALYMMHRLGLMSLEDAEARDHAAFERYIDAKYTRAEEAGEG